MEDKENTQKISSDDLWAKAAHSGVISREELGIDKKDSANRIETINENGYELFCYRLSSDKSKKELKHGPEVFPQLDNI